MLCKVCNKNLSDSNFRKSKTHGRSLICKVCSNNLILKGFKVCSCCGEILPLTIDYFNKNSKSKYGLDTQCKICVRNKVSNWQKENKEKAYEHVKRYISSEKGKRINISKYTRYVAKKKNLNHTLTDEQWENIKSDFNNCCAYCGKPQKLEREHIIPLSKGGHYTVNNIIPACKSCNTSKKNKDLLTWFRTQPFYLVEREKKIMERI